MANKISDETIEYVGILAKLELSGQEKEDAKADMEKMLDWVVDYDTATTADTKRYAEYYNHLLENGIYAAPSQFEAMFVSFAHTEDDIEKTCQVIESFK